MNDFPSRLKATRMKRKLYQKDMARYLGIETNAYQKYEYGQREPRYDMLLSIADYLDVSLDYLFGRSDNPDSHRERQEIAPKPFSVACLRGILETVSCSTSNKLVMRYSRDDFWPELQEYPYDTVLYHMKQMEDAHLISKVDWTNGNACLIYGVTADGEHLLEILRNERWFHKLADLTKNESWTLTDLMDQALE